MMQDFGVRLETLLYFSILDASKSRYLSIQQRSSQIHLIQGILCHYLDKLRFRLNFWLENKVSQMISVSARPRI